MNTLNIYGAGGCGINLASNFVKYKQQDSEGFAKINPVFLDTSHSNLKPGIDQDSVYIFDGLDGSGKKRDSNYNTISERSKELLHRFKPADVNVVVHSASGGSGSVIGPVLVSELLSRNALTIVVMVGGSDSRIEAMNTSKTLQSYEMIAQKRGLPVVAVYHENSKDNPRGSVDQRINTTIVLLASFFSNMNRELDSSDMRNFLNYHHVTSFKPKLCMLDFFSKSIELGRDHTAVSVVTLTDDSTNSSLNIPVEYQAVGFVNENAKAAISVDLPIHSVVVSGAFVEVVNRLDKKLEEIDTARLSVVEKSIVNSDVRATDDGLVF